MAETDPLTPPPGRRIALCDRGAVGPVAVAAIAPTLPEDRGWRPIDRPGHLGERLAAFPKGRNAVSFFLRELLVPTHRCVLFLAENDAPVGLQLSQFSSRALHLV